VKDATERADPRPAGLGSAVVLGALLDDRDVPEVHRNIAALTFARLTGNACYRFTYPFVALIASGLDVSLQRMGVALAIAELAGLLSPLTGRLADHLGQRQAMAGGLAAVSLGAALAATAQGVAWLAVSLVVLSQSKVLFDLGLTSWIAEQVPYERRGRIVGLTETSWAGGLLLGVTTMGLVTAATNWRIGYLTGAAAGLVMAAVVWRRVSPLPARHDRVAAAPTGRIPRWGWWAVLAVACLMGASQALFVTFGSWLEDAFGVGAVGLAAITFALGLGELFASLTSARRTDEWGKELSTAGGAALMVPTGLVLAVWHDQMAVGIVLLVIAILGFEFGIVSSLAIGSRLVPGSPARGVGAMIAAGTSGRALVSVPATALYERSGFGWPAAMSAVLACGTIVAMIVVRRYADRV
jgi:predicted MFS family arabinose efflux permease